MHVLCMYTHGDKRTTKCQSSDTDDLFLLDTGSVTGLDLTESPGICRLLLPSTRITTTSHTGALHEVLRNKHF